MILLVFVGAGDSFVDIHFSVEVAFLDVEHDGQIVECFVVLAVEFDGFFVVIDGFVSDSFVIVSIS